jgi:hypothetical protein
VALFTTPSRERRRRTAFLYDAPSRQATARRRARAAIFGDFDSLAWDLGNPDDVVLNNPNPFTRTIGENQTSIR